jgi:hypothetical protein
LVPIHLANIQVFLTCESLAINRLVHDELRLLPALNFAQNGVKFVGIVQFQNEIQTNYPQFLLDFDKVNIICMKWGDKFPSEYVNRLYSMVNRNLSLPFRFVCFTEDDSGIRNEVEVQPLPKLDLPNNAPERGWRKLTVFKKDFGGLSGKTLFLDLDVVIVDNIDVFFTVEGDFLIAHDKKNPTKIEGNSSVFRFEIGQYLPLIPLIASGGLGNPWKIITLAPLGINGALSQDFIHDGQQRYLKLGTHSSCQYSSFPNL